MVQLNSEKEVKHILATLAKHPGLRLGEIHAHLEGMDASAFTESPARGEGYNDERYILKGLIEFLSVKKDWISSDGNKWSLTERGRREVP